MLWTKMDFKSLLYFLGATFCIHLVSAAPKVSLDVGIVKGSNIRTPGVDGTTVYAYYGIPFAEPPVGEHRFQPPKPFEGKGHNKVISSKTFRSSCWQAEFPGFPPLPRSEDCLFLNVFTPSTGSGSSLKKVMVWIHGGGFEVGDTRSYIPTLMVANKDVIVVTVQYRLALLGFLSSGDDILPGNLGLRDQIMALEWVKKYIARFGGDPDDVTLFGESAGSACVSILSLSPAAKGLFSKVIMQSGTALSPWAISDNHEEEFYEIARQTGCEPWFILPRSDSNFHTTVLDCLMNIDEGTEEFQRMENIQGVSFAPVVDGDLIPRDPYLLLQDRHYLKRIGALDRSYVIGITNNEGGLLAAFTHLHNLTDPVVAEDFIQSSANSLYPDPVDKSALDYLDFFYTQPRDSEDRVPLQNMLDMYSDVNFVVPSLFMARLLTRISNKIPVYVFLFDYNPPLSNPNGQLKGSLHAADVLYQFDYDLDAFYIRGLYLQDPNRHAVRDEFGGALAEFAKSGRPSSSNIAWPRFDSTDEFYTAVSQEPHIDQRMYAQRLSVWTESLPGLLGNMQPNGRGYRLAFWPF